MPGSGRPRVGHQPGKETSSNDDEAATLTTDEFWAPACMADREWALWRKVNARTSAQDRAVRPCADCPISFALEMRAEGRCNGLPGQEVVTTEAVR